MTACHYCHSTDREVRPYGPGGADVCHPCATATPEREAQAKAAFDVMMEAAEAASPHGVAVISANLPPSPLLLDDDGCVWCGDGESPEGECPGSQRRCGHHCNHLDSGDECCWCPAHINDDGELVAG